MSEKTEGKLDISENIRPVSDLTTKATELVKQINDFRRPVFLTQDGRACGVLVDPQTFEGTRRALAMLKLLAQGERDIEENRFSLQKDIFAALEKKLQDNRQEAF